MNISDQQHWDKVYSTKAEEEVSWFQPYPKTSIMFASNRRLNNSTNSIDVFG